MILGLFAVISYSIITVSSGAKSGIENPFTGSYVGCEIPFILTHRPRNSLRWVAED